MGRLGLIGCVGTDCENMNKSNLSSAGVSKMAQGCYE